MPLPFNPDQRIAEQIILANYSQPNPERPMPVNLLVRIMQIQIANGKMPQFDTREKLRAKLTERPAE